MLKAAKVTYMDSNTISVSHTSINCAIVTIVLVPKLPKIVHIAVHDPIRTDHAALRGEISQGLKRPRRKYKEQSAKIHLVVV